eukprot:3344112-Pleurochrysis_carterae.AAC.2
MDQTGHMTWPVRFDPRTQAALRKQIRHHVRTMLADTSQYLISPTMAATLEQESSKLLQRPAARPQATSAAGCSTAASTALT